MYVFFIIKIFMFNVDHLNNKEKYKKDLVSLAHISWNWLAYNKKKYKLVYNTSGLSFENVT